MIDKVRTPPPILEEALYRRSLDSTSPVWSYHNHVLQGSLLRYIRRPLKRKDVSAYRLALVAGLHKGSLCELKLHPESIVNISLADENSEHQYTISVSGFDMHGETSTWELALPTSDMQNEWLYLLRSSCNFIESLEASGEMEQLVDLAKAMLPDLHIHNRLHQFTIYPKCFLGNNAVGCLMSQHNISTANAVAICNRLMSAGLLEHVTHEHVFCKGRRYYRLTNVSGSLEEGELPIGIPSECDFDPFNALINEPEEPTTVIQSPLLVLTLSLRREVKKITSELSREKKITEALKAKYDAQYTAYMCTAEARETPPSSDNFMNGINVVLSLTSMWLIALGFYPYEIVVTMSVILVGSVVYCSVVRKAPNEGVSDVPAVFPSSEDIIRGIQPAVEHMDGEEEEEEFDGDGIDSDDDDGDDAFDLLLCDQCIASHEESDGNHGRLSLGLSSPTPATSPMHDTTSTTGGRERTDSVDQPTRLRRRLTDSLSKLARLTNPLASPNRDGSLSTSSFQGAGTYDDIALEVSSTADHDKYSFREMYQPARWPNRPILLKRCASGVPQNVLLNDEARKEWLKPIPLHKEDNVCMSEFPIETDYFIGKGYMVVDGLVDSPSLYFSCRKHNFRVVIQGRFKETVPFAKAYTGQTYESPIGNLPAKWLIRTVLLLLSRMQPALKVRLDGDHPFVLSPLASTAQNIVANKPGQEINISDLENIKENLTLLGPEFASMSSRQRKQFFSKRANLNKFSFCPDLVYTFDFYQHVLNLATFQVELGFAKLDIMSIIGARPVQIMTVMWDEGMKDEGPNKSSPNVKVKDWQYLYNIEVWHERCVNRDIMPFLKGLGES